MTEDAYMIYVEKYGKLAGGEKLNSFDFGEMKRGGLVKYKSENLLAVTLAANDVKFGVPLRSKKKLEQQIKEMQGPQ